MENNLYLDIADLDVTNILIKYIKNEKNDATIDMYDSDDDSFKIIYEYTEKICMVSKSDPNKYHKYCGFNKFTKETFFFPNEWIDIEQVILDDFEYHGIDDDMDLYDDQENNYSQNYIEKFYLNRKLLYFQKLISESVCNINNKLFSHHEVIDFNVLYNGWYHYKTLDNIDCGFHIFIDPSMKNVCIYGRTNNIIPDTERYIAINDITHFNNLIGNYQPLEIFIGKSSCNEMTIYSGGYGKRYDGNTILLRIGNVTEFKYLSIGINIYEFTTDEKIIAYHSSVGNNCVTYAYAESYNWCYDISTHTRIRSNLCNDREERGEVFPTSMENYTVFNITEIASRDIYKEYRERPVDHKHKKLKKIPYSDIKQAYV